MVNWAKGLDELGAGLLRQADIGGLAYKDATTKEAERRAESRLISAERRALIAAKAEEKRANIEWGRRAGISEQIAKDAATALAGAKRDLQDDRIKGLKDAAKLLADERAALVTKTRTEAIADAVKKAESEEAKERIKASVKRAEKAEAKVTELYDGLPEANAEWDPETQSWKSGGAYMDMIYAAQDLARAAWKATGIAPLMSERNINEPKFSYLSRSIASGISYELKEKKPDVWKGIVEGLQSEKTSSDYKEAIKTITPYLNDAIKESSIRTTSTEKAAIIEEIIQGIKAIQKYDQLVEDLGDDGDGNTGKTGTTDTSLTPSLLSSIFGGDPLDNIAPDITKEDIGTVKKAQAALDATPTTARGRRPSGHKSQLQKDLEKAKKRDPEYLLIHLKEEKIRIEKQLATSTYNTPKWVQERLDKINELIKRFSSMLPPENPQASALPPASNTSLPPGMLNTGGGMISSAGLSPAALAYWEPDVADARAKAMQRTS